MSLLSVAATPAVASPPEPAYSPPPREASPFTPKDSFCSATDNTFADVQPGDPRLARRITVVMLTPKAAPAGAGSHVGDPIDEARTFATLINQCGGIGGRKLDFHVVVESGNPLADCLTATRVLQPVVVVAWTASEAQSCIVRQSRTVMITGSDAANADLVGAQGRLAATGSSEGTLQAKMQALIDSGRLDHKRVALDVNPDDPAGTEFSRLARILLAAQKIPVAPRARADVVLTSAIDPRALGLGQLGGSPIEIYGFSDTPGLPIDAVRTSGEVPVSSLDTTTGLYSWTPITDEQALTGKEDGQFVRMCNAAYDANHGKAVTAAQLPEPSPPAGSNAPYLRVAKVCLVMRILARSLYNAGVDPSPEAVVTALHKLAYIENVLPDGTPKPRPNQIVNEPVTRLAQVVVLSQARYPCERRSAPDTTVAPTRSLPPVVCWAPASGWENGRAVNAPLLPTSARSTRSISRATSR